MHQLRITAIRSEALFVSALQRSDNPDARQVQQAIAGAVRAYGGRGCAARVAQEFGDHPETAVVRMRWAREVVGATFPAPSHEATYLLRPALAHAG
ncbi:MAG: hypothetical protein E6G35_11770 [Actinobacteria bacterium]|nr:MAG: hypothetical protein E6G35_11770 [Actinomycetota bacterium]